MSNLAVLGVRDFRWFFAGSLTSLVGDFMAPVALTFAVLAIGGPRDLGIVLAARIVPLVAFMLLGGVIADSLPRRAVMLSSDLMRSVSQGTLAVLLVTGHAQVWHMVLLQFVHGSASALFTPAVTGLVAQTVPAERLPEANSLRSLAGSAGQLAGPALSGVIVALVGVGWAIAVDAGTFAVSALCLRQLAPTAVHGQLQSRTILTDLRDGWREFTARQWVWAIVVVASLLNGLQAAYTVLGPLVALKRLGGPAIWGLILTCGGAGAVFGGFATLWLRTATPLRTAVFAVSFLPAPILALAAGAPAAAVAAAAFASGCGLIAFNTLWETTLQRSVPAHRLSRVSAYEWMGSYACNPIGLFVIPILASQLGRQTVLWGSGLAMLTLILALLLVPGISTDRQAGQNDAPLSFSKH